MIISSFITWAEMSHETENIPKSNAMITLYLDLGLCMQRKEIHMVELNEAYI